MEEKEEKHPETESGVTSAAAKENSAQQTQESAKTPENKLITSNFFQNDILHPSNLMKQTQNGPIIIKKQVDPIVLKSPIPAKNTEAQVANQQSSQPVPKATIIQKKNIVPNEPPRVQNPPQTQVSTMTSFLKPSNEPATASQPLQPTIKSFRQQLSVVKFNQDTSKRPRVIVAQQHTPQITQQPQVFYPNQAPQPAQNTQTTQNTTTTTIQSGLSLNSIINTPQQPLYISNLMQSQPQQVKVIRPQQPITQQPQIQTQQQQILRIQPQTHVITRHPGNQLIPTTTILLRTPAQAQPQIIQKPPEPKEPAAPFPELPRAEDIQNIINELTNEINEQQAKLNELEQEREYCMLSVPPMSEATEKSQIYDFHNNIYAKSNQPDIKKRNMELARKSHAKQEFPQKKAQEQMYRHISQLPLFHQEIEENHEYIEPIVQTILQRKKMTELKGRQLAQEYVQRREKWVESNSFLETYQLEMHEKVDLWPPEFSKAIIKGNDRSCVQYAAKDNMMEMYLDPEEQEAMYFYNENGLVEDPVAEHDAFRHRVSWTEQEKQIFYEKYKAHPKEFKKIAAALPTKTIKEVIEFYFINRRKMNLKEADTAQRKRGRKRIITEG